MLTAVVMAVLAAGAILLLRAASNDDEGGDPTPAAAEGCPVTLRFDGRDYAGVPPEAARLFATGAGLGAGTHPLGCANDGAGDEPVDVVALDGVDPAEAVGGAIAIDGTPTPHVWIRGARCARSPSLAELADCLRTPAAGATSAAG